MKKLLNIFKTLFLFIKRITGYLADDIASLFLVVIFIFAVIGYFVNDMNFTYLLAFAVLYILGTLYQMRQFIDHLIITAIKFPDKTIREFLIENRLMPAKIPVKKKEPLFARIIKIIIITVALAGAAIAAYYLVTGNDII